ncbi:MAG: bifunctional riboflavin kinase/FMN adenylyltransferase, partial [Pseudomonadota bacterium]|nr:bifunctional riboflavin kinase/FMN adenylyltransferase [Pseudomonadota bacterium]
MYLIRGQSNIELFREKHPKDTFIATIGNFDGLHLGHKEILKNMLAIAKRKKLKRMVIFTEPHAKEFFAEEILSVEAPPRISPWRDKYLSLKKNGVDVAFFLKFNSNLKGMTPEIFADDILGNLQIRSLMIGDDFKFGKDRKGDFNFLVNWGKKKGVDVLKTETFKINDKRVSSTRIREALINNDFEEAKILLDRPYTFSGKVVHGNQLG